MTDNEFGLRREPEHDNKEKRTYHLNPGEWAELFRLIYRVVQQGAAASLYTSRDRSAICVAVKHGKDRRAYWIGPDDTPFDVLDHVHNEWGMYRTTTPLGEWLDICIEDDRRSGDAD